MTPTREDFAREERMRWRSVLQDIATRHPGLAAFTRGGSALDPLIELLGLAQAELYGDARFLFAGFLPNLSAVALTRLAPHAASDLPPATTFECRTSDRTAGVLKLGRGSIFRPVKSATRGGLTECLFRAPPWPSARRWRITEAKWNSFPADRSPTPPGTSAVFRLMIEPVPGAEGMLCPRRVRIYCAAEMDVAAQLLQAVFAESVGTFVQVGSVGWTTAKVLPAGFSGGLLPAGRGLPGRRRFLETIGYPGVVPFIDVVLPETPKNKWPLIVQIACRVDRPILRAINPNVMKLNCVPAVNLFETVLSIIRPTDGQDNYPLRIDDRDRGGAAVYAVDGVTEVSRDPTTQQERRVIVPEWGRGDGPVGWTFVRGDNPVLHLTDRRSAQPLGVRLEVRITASNRDRAVDIATATRFRVDGTAGWEATPLYRPTAPLCPPSDPTAAGGLHSHLAPPRLVALNDQAAANALRCRARAVAPVGWTTHPDVGTGDTRPSDADRAINGISRVRVDWSGGNPVVHIALDPRHYVDGAGWAFGESLRRFVQSDWPVGPKPEIEVTFQEFEE